MVAEFWCQTPDYNLSVYRLFVYQDQLQGTLVNLNVALNLMPQENPINKMTPQITDPRGTISTTTMRPHQQREKKSRQEYEIIKCRP